jgi:hypothetical protein
MYKTRKPITKECPLCLKNLGREAWQVKFHHHGPFESHQINQLVCQSASLTFFILVKGLPVITPKSHRPINADCPSAHSKVKSSAAEVRQVHASSHYSSLELACALRLPHIAVTCALVYVRNLRMRRSNSTITSTRHSMRGTRASCVWKRATDGNQPWPNGNVSSHASAKSDNPLH